MGIYAWGCHGSRGPMKDVIGGRPWGYMHGGAMEVGAVWGRSWGGGRGDICMGMPWKSGPYGDGYGGDICMRMYAGGGEEKRRGVDGTRLKSSNPTRRAGEK